MQKRELDFSDGDAVVADIQGLRNGGYIALGQWNLSQICQHLAKTMVGGMEGFGSRMPWIVRKLLGEPLIRRILRERRMASGIPAPRQVRPSPLSTIDDHKLINECLDVVARVREFSGPLPPHPMSDTLSLEDWRQLQWIHAAHHLGFLIPSEVEADRR